jgi:hypothetical protein
MTFYIERVCGGWDVVWSIFKDEPVNFVGITFQLEHTKKQNTFPSLLFTYSLKNKQIWLQNICRNLIRNWLTLQSGRAIAQAVSRRLPTAAARVQTRVRSRGILWWTKVAPGQVFSENFGFPCQSTFPICFSTIIFTITQGWHNRLGVAAVPIASQTN